MKEISNEEKDLLIRDLCARLPYGLKVCYINLSDEMPKVWDLIGMPTPHLADILVEGSYRFAAVNIEESIRPYLRPMSSMTGEEREEMGRAIQKDRIEPYGEIKNCGEDNLLLCTMRQSTNLQDWLNVNHFDYRGLIPKGLALEALEGMYES